MEKENSDWGVVPGYEDARGQWKETPEKTRAEIVRAMRVDPESPPSASSTRVVQPGDRSPPGELVLEDGTTLEVNGRLPPDLPFGYHRLHPRRSGDVLTLIASPLRCPLPEDFPTWGWSVQLHSLRSQASWGIGDFSDLGRLARWSARELRAGFLLVNPLNPATPVVPQQPSPYLPTTRRYRNPLYLAVEEVPGASTSGVGLEELAARARALNQSPTIDRDEVFRLKRTALETIWSRFGDSREFERYRAAAGESLFRFATFCALAERHGPSWRRWPEEHRRADSPGVRGFAEANARRIRFHEWVQWLLDEQLARAGEEIRLMQDLAIGSDPDGADAWEWQDLLALDASIGAPPDLYNVNGQDWGMPPFIPHRLQAVGYQPFIEILRATLRHAGALRIDHVMGLFRLFWIPKELEPKEGSYVLYPGRDLLAIVALECHRAGAPAVGEDLGTVDEAVREQLSDSSVLSYRLMWFETDSPARYPRLALAAVTTHDLPTIAGLWSGEDLEEQKRLGLEPNEKGMIEIRERLARMTGLGADAPVREVILRAHELLGEAPSVAVAATLEDATAQYQRPNMPGADRVRPNWSLALPLTLEELQRSPVAREIADVLAHRRAARRRG